MSHHSWRLSFSLRTALTASFFVGGVFLTVAGWHTWTPVFRMDLRTGTINSFKLSQDGQHLVWRQGTKVGIANLIEGTSEFLPDEREGVPVADVALLGNGAFAVLRNDGCVEFRSLRGLECWNVLRLDAPTPDGVVEGVAKDGGAVCLRQQDTVYLVDVKKSKVLPFRISGVKPTTKEQISLSPCGSYIATVEVTHQFTLWQGSYSASSCVSLLNAPAPLERIVVTRRETPSVLIAFDRNGRRLACADDDSVSIFSVPDCKETACFQMIRQQISAIEFSPDDLGLLVAGDAGIARWDIHDPKPRWTKDLPALTAMFVGNGDRVAAVHSTYSDGMAIDVLDSSTGATLGRIADLPNPWRDYSERVQIDRAGNTAAACFMNGQRFVAYRRNFSERWYGHLTRPEVWTVLVSGFLLACIAVRRRAIASVVAQRPSGGSGVEGLRPAPSSEQQ